MAEDLLCDAPVVLLHGRFGIPRCSGSVSEVLDALGGIAGALETP